MKQSKRSLSRQVDKVGFAWYRANQWEQLRAVAIDRDTLHDTYAAWVVDATRAFMELQKAGVDAQKIDVDLDELMDWCKRKHCVVDGEARSMFVADKVRQLNQGTRKAKGNA